MAKKSKGLGRGLSAIFGEETVRKSNQNQSTKNVSNSNPQNTDKTNNTVNTEQDESKVTVPKGTDIKNTDILITDSNSDNKIPDNIKDQNDSQITASGEVLVKLSYIEPNIEQPRKTFNEEKLKELTESVRQYGVLQPLIVKKKSPTSYEIIAGERRFRAAQAAGLKEVPVVIRDYEKQKAMEISIIENVQRADLNPVEEARAYEKLIMDYGLKQEEIAARVSKDRSTVTNALRLLKLSPDVQEMMVQGLLSSGHARALLGVSDQEKQTTMAQEIIAKNLSVREVEKMVKGLNKKPRDVKDNTDDRNLSVFFEEYEDKIRAKFATKVHINRKDKNKGRIEIEYYSSAELERIMDLINTIRS